MDLGIRGRAAFVAASSKGMGRAIAECFAAEGADVGMCARDEQALNAAAESVRSHGTRVVATVADVADGAQVANAIARTVQAFGRLDTLVVNAGGPPRGTFEELDDDSWYRWYDVLFMSAVRMIRDALPALRASDAPSILFIASSTVRQQLPGLTLSNSIRGAVNGLSKTLAN